MGTILVQGQAVNDRKKKRGKIGTSRSQKMVISLWTYHMTYH